MRLKFSNLIISLFLIIFTFSSCSSSFDYNKFDFKEIDGGYEMTQSLSFWDMYEKYEGVLSIPETYNGKPILKISNMGSSFGRGITKIVGSKNLKTISSWTFAGQDGNSMPNLISVEFSKQANLKTIETMAFFWCKNLKTVVLPDQFLNFDDGVFERCYNLENLIIYNEWPPTMKGDIFNSDGNLMNDKYWHTTPKENFKIFVPDDSVEIYKQSNWGKYSIMPISSFNRN